MKKPEFSSAIAESAAQGAVMTANEVLQELSRLRINMICRPGRGAWRALAAALARVHGPERSDDGNQVGRRRRAPRRGLVRKAAPKGKRARA